MDDEVIEYITLVDDGTFFVNAFIHQDQSVIIQTDWTENGRQTRTRYRVDPTSMRELVDTYRQYFE